MVGDDGARLSARGDVRAALGIGKTVPLVGQVLFNQQAQRAAELLREDDEAGCVARECNVLDGR
jgi:hypothetical protein